MQNTRPILAWETLLELAAVPGPRATLRDRLETALRRAIDDGTLPLGSALPPSRALAETLGVSRWVVTEVYGQLVAEGVLDARTGSATTVAVTAPTHTPGRGPRSTPAVTTPPRFDLRPGLPDLRGIPRARWAAALRAALTELPDQAFAADHGRGHDAARETLVTYLARSRRVAASAGDVVITHGATDGMRQLARELHRRGHRHLLVEDPSWPRLRDVAEESGLTVVSVPVDADGIDATALEAAASATGARAALLTPAHQFPLGAALSPQRREQIVSWARCADAVLIEDDYDAEFRYDRRPVAALQRLAPDRVVLIGSLSKSVAPGIGLGWMVLPPGFELTTATGIPSLIDQAALAHFVTHGDLERHLRRSRMRFRHRRGRLLDALDRELEDLRRTLGGLEVTGIAAGMHLVLSLPPGMDAADVTGRASAHSLALVPLRRYVLERPRPEALVLGYGDLDDALVDEAAALLAGVLRAAAAA
ncbi:PLP-dependent aminotransferase family protein [Microbacterium sp. M28]|uniref:MocR-like pyridoxine biosynthesis transcription factor PdxR n=1 Tax=Microbacterium sp. M28 TaxID=2962064 RepID=UPI0021F45F22|nr:PLP-dependent aminotransferase family protein [Microbacterium sp. M28]UYO97814.1 PLP-dependent aminotransferase family protein [Microbacterium sp. M28]